MNITGPIEARRQIPELRAQQFVSGDEHHRPH